MFPNSLIMIWYSFGALAGILVIPFEILEVKYSPTLWYLPLVVLTCSAWFFVTGVYMSKQNSKEKTEKK